MIDNFRSFWDDNSTSLWDVPVYPYTQIVYEYNDNLFNNSLKFCPLARTAADLTPFVLYKTKNEGEFLMNVPGYQKEDIKIQTKGNKLLISINVENDEFKNTNQKHEHDIPQEFSTKNVKSKLESGILKINFKTNDTTKDVPIE